MEEEDRPMYSDSGGVNMRLVKIDTISDPVVSVKSSHSEGPAVGRVIIANTISPACSD